MAVSAAPREREGHRSFPSEAGRRRFSAKREEVSYAENREGRNARKSTSWTYGIGSPSPLAAAWAPHEDKDGAKRSSSRVHSVATPPSQSPTPLHPHSSRPDATSIVVPSRSRGGIPRQTSTSASLNRSRIASHPQFRSSTPSAGGRSRRATPGAGGVALPACRGSWRRARRPPRGVAAHLAPAAVAPCLKAFARGSKRCGHTFLP